MVLGGSPRGWGCRRGRRVESDSRFCFSFRFCFMSDLCAHGQSLLIWVFFEDPQGELTRNVYDDDDEDDDNYPHICTIIYDWNAVGTS